MVRVCAVGVCLSASPLERTSFYGLSRTRCTTLHVHVVGGSPLRADMHSLLLLTNNFSLSSESISGADFFFGFHSLLRLVMLERSLVYDGKIWDNSIMRRFFVLYSR